MKRKRNLRKDKITIENILKELSSDFEAAYAELLSNLCKKPSYKRLRGTGEQQFFNATESSIPIEEESHRIKMRFAEINLLAVSADNAIDSIISEKFQSNFLSILKEEVLNVILKLYAEQTGSTVDDFKCTQFSQSTENSTEVNMKDNEKVILEKLKDLNKYFAQNLNDISKQVIEMPLANTTTSTAENIKSVLSNIKKEDKEELENTNFDLGNLSFDTISSVHTSDLSSFNDDISISSDEETGIKRKRLSFKMADEKIVQLRVKRKEASINQDQAKEIKSEESQLEMSANASTPHKFLPRRVRKPNAKYTACDISSFRKKSAEKETPNKSSLPSQESETASTLSRKRGRPKKIIP